MLYWENDVPYNGQVRKVSTVKTGVLDQGVCAKAYKRRWWCVETFNNIRNKIFNNNLVTKTDPKRHRHSFATRQCVKEE
jgi:hypothetical protein